MSKKIVRDSFSCGGKQKKIRNSNSCEIALKKDVKEIPARTFQVPLKSQKKK